MDDSLREPGLQAISPRLLSQHLHMSIGELAVLTGLPRNSLLRSGRSARVQEKLGMITRILGLASDIVGETNLAVYWFRNELLAGFDGKRAIDLVTEGKASAVLAFLDMVEHGTPA